jgi:leucyl aminopeptidase (aminopeptidase T)
MVEQQRESGTGYSGLLNFDGARHQTVFLSDFEIRAPDQARIRAQLEHAPTQVHFQRLPDDPAALRPQLERIGVDFHHDYLSLQTLISTRSHVDTAYEFFAGVDRGDFTRVEMPYQEMGFEPFQVSHLLDVIMRADYVEQDRISDLFFSLLARQSPYEVVVQTAGDRLTVRDTRPWFELAGRLLPGEQRILPGGEVAYTGVTADGTITIDGAVFAVPQRPEVTPLSTQMTRQSAQLAKDPITLHIKSGQVTAVTGRGEPARALNALLEDESYRTVTEVGLSFNRACTAYIHDWSAASNEDRPGAHVGLGGDTEPNGDRPPAPGPLVHLDLMTANAQVTVNGHLFLQTSR